MGSLRRIVAWGLAASAIAVWLVSCFQDIQGNYVERRFRVDVTAEIDGQEFRAAAVWQLELRNSFGWNEASVPVGPDITVEGEAIPIVLASGETIFLLKRLEGGLSGKAAGALILQCIDTRRSSELLRTAASFEGGCDVGRHLEVAAVPPGSLGATAIPPIAALGGGPLKTGRVAIKRISVSLTDDPVTAGLTQQYPWILKMPTPEEVGGTSFTRLYRMDFTTLR